MEGMGRDETGRDGMGWDGCVVVYLWNFRVVRFRVGRRNNKRHQKRRYVEREKRKANVE